MSRPRKRGAEQRHTSEVGIGSFRARNDSRQPGPPAALTSRRALLGASHRLQPERRAFVGMHQRRRQTGISVVRRPPVLTDNAHCVALKDAGSSRGDQGYWRGVKRSYADDEAEGETLLWGCSVKASSDQKGIQKLRGSNDPVPQEATCRDLNETTGAAVGRQRGSHLLITGSSFHKIHRNYESDGAEEAEIRAEILNGVRQLLRDESEIDCLVRLCALLKEKNIALLERAIHRRGVEECAELLEETLVSGTAVFLQTQGHVRNWNN